MLSSTDHGKSGNVRLPRHLVWAEYLAKAFAESPLIPFFAVLLVVVLQTIRARGAWFYSDDWVAMASVESGLAQAFSIHNGHQTALAFVPYDALFTVFGMAHYSAFLLAAGLCNLVLGFAVLWWLRPRASPPLQVAIAVSCLIVPKADHTIFWLGASLNLLPIAAFLVWLGAIQRKSRWSLPILFASTTVCWGLGGYGLGALAGILVVAVLVGHRPSQAIAGLALAASVVPEALVRLSAQDSAGGAVPSFLVWLYASLDAVTAAIRLPIPLLAVAIAVLLSLTLRRVSVHLHSGLTWGRTLLILRSHCDAIALGASLGTFVLLIYIVRHGVETLDASRYILITVTLSTLLIVALATTRTRERPLRARSKVGASLVVVLACSTLLRVPGWMQASTNSAYLGSVNRDAVTQLICGGVSNAQIAETLADRDGLGALGAAMPTRIWSDYRSQVAENCPP